MEAPAERNPEKGSMLFFIRSFSVISQGSVFSHGSMRKMFRLSELRFNFAVELVHFREELPDCGTGLSPILDPCPDPSPGLFAVYCLIMDHYVGGA